MHQLICVLLEMIVVQKIQMKKRSRSLSMAEGNVQMFSRVVRSISELSEVKVVKIVLKGAFEMRHSV